MESGWIDISVPIFTGMAYWPDNPPVQMRRMMDMDRGDDCTVSVLSIGSHTGTHMDAPSHFIRTGLAMDQMPLDAGVGPARVIAIDDPDSIRLEEIRPCAIRRGERILFKTRNSGRRWEKEPFHKKFVYLSTEAAVFLARRQIRLVGVDYLSVGGYEKNGLEVHRALLGGGVWIVEGLNLSEADSGRYHLICLPLRMQGADGAPARAVLRRLASSKSGRKGKRK